ncbi:MAG: hypothetical protein JXA50_06150 [Deltaproteobacteria bacterium]|nr:hypothetical protein [Deltaproteobacteria bacterium]
MRRNRLFLFVLVCCAILALSCAKEKEVSDRGEAIKAKISAYTSGTISQESTIKVLFFVDMVDDTSLNTPLKKSPITFKPKIKGDAVWTDTRTLEFRPAQKLPEGEEYVATVHLADFMEIIGDTREFAFKFSTMQQSFEITVSGLEAPREEDPKWQQLSGKIVTADVEDNDKVEKLLEATQERKKMSISWAHADDRREHSFVIGGILRGDEPSKLILRWNGKAIGVDEKGERIITVPPISTFAVAEAKAVQVREQYIEVRFTDPLRKDQDLNGLIRVADRSDLKFTIEGNIVRVYSASPWSGTVMVKVEPGIRNVMGHQIKKAAEMSVVFEELKPQVRFVGKGAILPTSQGLTIPIEAVNLRAVMIVAMRVNEKNIPQFLQVNNLGGERELKRVGRIIWKKVIPLNFTPNKKNIWMRYGLDVSPLIRDEKGGLYRIILSFRRQHIVYDCPASTEEENQEALDTAFENLDEEAESSFWDFYEEDEDYSWGELYNQRKNPCHPGYYKKYHDHDITISRNVLVSDIGLIAKRGTDNTVFVAATDIKTAKPLAGVKLTLLDYQQQEIKTGLTKQDGTLVLQAERKPFLLIAKKGDQSGYLKLDDGSALSVSHFDVAGVAVQKGLKGFIYGERGVWRPGDPIYITFILMDSDRRLPKDYPVILELRNPKGQLVKKILRTQSLNGFYCYQLETDQNAPTGNWTVHVKVGDVTFEKVLKIETVMPNRLKIKLDFGDKKSLSEGNIAGDLSATWLHGAIAKNLKADFEVAFTPYRTSFPKYEAYAFDDPVRTYETESQSIFEGKLNDQGIAKISADIKTENVSPGMLMANFKTRVFEPGGAFSIDRFSIPYHPYKRYIGIRVPPGDKARGMLLTDTKHTVSIVALDTEGKPVSAGQVELKLYKIKWRWWWEKGAENLADYIGSSSYSPIKTDIIPIKNGVGEWQFEIKYPSWGRYLIRAHDMNGKHITGKIVYIDWPGWAGRAQKDTPGGATVLSFSSDKQEYTVGEKVTLTIPTGQQGRGLVSIESGTKVLETRWIEGGEEATRFEFLATRAMVPNVYVHVTFLQPHMQTGNDLPIRMYGVIPIKVDDPTTRLKPQIDATDVFKPEEKARITVSEKAGQPMTYTIAVVDEGLLDLTRFATPDPWEHFYTRESLGVKTWDLFDMVAGAYSGTLDQLLAIGGGFAEERIEAQRKATRFPPMVRFLGPFELKRNKKRSHEIDVPQYVGSVRIMVVAGQGGAFGAAQRAVFVRKPLMILGTLPRVIGPEEEVELPISVFAMEKAVKDVSVTVSTKGPLSIEGLTQKSISFTEPGDRLLNFRLKANAQTGIATVSMQATSGPEKAGHQIEIDVRMPGGPVTDVVETTIASNKQWKREVEFPGVAGTNEVTLEVSRIPPINLGKRLNYLIRYPHGCVEQVTSSVFPQLYLDKLLELSKDKQDRIQKNVAAGIERLRSFQTADGGFSFWPGTGGANDWVSSYAGHFLIEAKRAGYVVPASMVEQWKAYQRKEALSWTAGPAQAEHIQAYRLYTLALAGAADLGTMNRLKETKNLPTAARWRLAAAYQLAGQPEAAKQVAKDVSLLISTYREFSNTYGSELRDKAMILESLCLMNQMEKAASLVKEISEQLSSGKWMSTQTTAYALVAMARYAGIAEGGGKIEFTFTWNKEKKRTVSSPSPVIQLPLNTNNSTAGVINITNKGKIIIYPRLIIEGIPALGREKAAENGMTIDVKYRTLDGNALDPTVLDQGTDFVAEVTIKNTGKIGTYEEVALSHLFPSGWEIHNVRMDATEVVKSSAFDYQDIRDDRVYTYFDIKRGESKTFTVLLNASYLGKFYLPMVSTEVMYDGTINARTPGKWITVERPGGGN